VLLGLAACGGGREIQIQNLPQRWSGVEQWPSASAAVARAFAAAPVTFGLRDLRSDPTAVGRYEENGFIVRTSDNVGQYCTDRIGEMFTHAGAHLGPGPIAVELELLDYLVVEGSTFVGTARVRAIVRTGAGEPWSKTYTGANTRWGRTHNPVNFQETLSNALANAIAQLLQDTEFAKALGDKDPPPNAPTLQPGQHPGSSRG
jgi:hypothetical protein